MLTIQRLTARLCSPGFDFSRLTLQQHRCPLFGGPCGAVPGGSSGQGTNPISPGVCAKSLLRARPTELLAGGCLQALLAHMGCETAPCRTPAGAGSEGMRHRYSLQGSASRPCPPNVQILSSKTAPSSKTPPSTAAALLLCQAAASSAAGVNGSVKPPGCETRSRHLARLIGNTQA